MELFGKTKESIMANIVANIIDGYVVYGNVEGRGDRTVLAYAISRRIAEEFAQGKGTSGGSADVDPCNFLIANHPETGERMVPINGGKHIRWVPYLTKNMESFEQEEGCKALEWFDPIVQIPVGALPAQWQKMTRKSKDKLLKAYRNR